MSVRSHSVIPRQARRPANEPRGRLWICTTSFESEEVDPFQPLRENQIYVKGQLEKGEGGYLHWQWTLHCGNPVRLGRLKSWFPTTHFELSRSSAAESYCEKEESRWEIEGAVVNFEKGRKKLNPNSKVDWDGIKEYAKSGELDAIPSGLYIR